MSLRDETVYGERIGDVLPGLRAFMDAAVYDDSGGFESSVTLEPDVAQPLCRAMMRVQAELLLEDADSLGSDAYGDRTHEQRAADALVRLAVRLGGMAPPLRRVRSLPDGTDARTPIHVDVLVQVAIDGVGDGAVGHPRAG